MPVIHGGGRQRVRAVRHGITRSSSANPLLLFIVAGQSNAQGLGVASGVTNFPNISDPVPSIQYYEQSAGNVTDPPSWGTEGPRSLAPRAISVGGQLAGTFGVELTLGRALQTAGVNACIAKFALSGAGLEDHFLNASYPTAGPSLYAQMSAFISNRLSSFGAAQVGGMVWVQGEADAGGIPDEANYKTNLETLFTNLRSSFGNFPIVINRLTSSYAAAGGVSALRSLQESFANTFATTGIVFNDDTGMRDAAHFDDNGYATLGTRLGAELLRLRANTALATPRWLAAGPPVAATSLQPLTPTWPVGHQAGDRGYLILSGLGINNYTLSTPAGFTEVAASPQYGGSSLLSRLHVWECVATSSSQASPVIADAASDDAKTALIVVVRGGSALNASAGSNTGATSATAVTFPGLTTTVSNTLVLNILAHRVDLSTAQVSGFTNADLTSLTEQIDICTATGAGFGISVATGYKATAGAVAGTTATLANTSVQSTITLAIAP